MKRPELLSPAGSGPAMVAAVQCGADAVYLGAGEFNARKSAENFGGELDSAVAYCHARGVKVHVTLNTMIRQDEVKRMEKTILDVASSGADAVIVQDLGTARMLREMVPRLALHASTQMAVHNPQGVEFLAKNGFSRVVLAREMSYREIARCRDLGAELEVFVHGALCVSCSGQCLLSSLIGGRSGNRGMCAQPCRMQYSMDGREGYLLSTKDLFGMEGLEALLDAGADSLKIEGRLKRPEYVAVTTAAYRGAIDDLLSSRMIDKKSARARLAQMFNRGGFTEGYGFGVQDTELMYRVRPNHIGTVVGSCSRNGEISLTQAIDPSDVLALRRKSLDDIPVHPRETASPVHIANAVKGDRLIRLVSASQMNEAKASFSGEFRKFPVSMHLLMRVGTPAELTMCDGEHTVTEAGAVVQTALSRPADPERIHAQLEKLGDTPFMISEYSADIDDNAYLPVSALNALRRIAAERLLESRFGKPYETEVLTVPAVSSEKVEIPGIVVQSSDPGVLVRALSAGADRALFAPADLRAGALERAAEVLPPRFDLLLPPVMTEDTMKTLHKWASLNADRIARTQLSNISQFDYSWPGELAGDSYLNIANNYAVESLIHLGVDIYTPSVELNRAQLDAIGGRKQLIVYGRLPLMLLRHCPLRAVNDLKGRHCDCRRCDTAKAIDTLDTRSLTDRTGAAFPLRRIASDDGCVIRLMNSAPLMLLRRSSSLPGCSEWRLIIEPNEQVEELIRLHRLAAMGTDVRSEALVAEAANTTTGHYFRGAE